MNLDDYVLDHEGVDWGNLLRNWSDLLPSVVTVWLVNCYGEAFLVFDDGTVHHFQPEGDSVEKVAESRDDFATKTDQGDNVNQWLMIPLVDKVRGAGITLGPGQCYGFALPTILGGDYTVENTRVKPIEEYHSFLANLHSQIRDLPDGALVQIKRVD